MSSRKIIGADALASSDKFQKRAAAAAAATASESTAAPAPQSPATTAAPQRTATRSQTATPKNFAVPIPGTSSGSTVRGHTASTTGTAIGSSPAVLNQLVGELAQEITNAFERNGALIDVVLHEQFERVKADTSLSPAQRLAAIADLATQIQLTSRHDIPTSAIDLHELHSKQQHPPSTEHEKFRRQLEVSGELHNSADTDGRAIPLLLPSNMTWRNGALATGEGERGPLVPVPEALEILRAITLPVAVLCVAGVARSGKSYVLNELVGRDVDGNVPNGGFDLGHTMEAKTMGLWIWSRPFRRTLTRADSSQIDVAVILIDSEGVDHMDSTHANDDAVFVMSLLLSSLLVYNTRAPILATDVDQLHYILEIGRGMMRGSALKDLEYLKDPKKLDKNDSHGDSVDIANMRDALPSLVWLIRDSFLLVKDAEGREISILQWLGDIANPARSSSKSADAVRKSLSEIMDAFPAFSAESLPRPSANPNVIQHIEDARFRAEISAEFVQRARLLRQSLWQQLVPKRSADGRSFVTGVQLAELCVVYSSAIANGHALPRWVDAWTGALESSFAAAQEQATAVYDSAMREAVMTAQPCLDDIAFGVAHRRAYAAALETFHAKAAICIDKTVLDEQLDKLDALLKQASASGAPSVYDRYASINYARSEAHCRAVVASLEPMVQELARRVRVAAADGTLSIDAMSHQVHVTVAEFAARARGPAAEAVQSEFECDIARRGDELLKSAEAYREAQARLAELAEQAKTAAQEAAAMRAQLAQLTAGENAELRMQAARAATAAAMERLRAEAAEAGANLARRTARMAELADANLSELRARHERELAALVASHDQRLAQLESQAAATEVALQQARAALAERQRQIAIAQQQQQQRRRGCFAGDSAVEVQRSGDHVIAVLACEVRVGDRVRSVDAHGNNTFADVCLTRYTPGHTHRVQTLWSGERALVRATDEHLVFVSHRTLPVPMKSVRVGDLVHVWSASTARTELVPVTRVSESTCVGLVTIFTLNHCLLVDGVVLSCYERSHIWGMFESVDTRLLYRFAPSVLKQAWYRKVVAWWDGVFD